MIKLFTETDLTSFGNYLLSKERMNNTNENNKGTVTHADFMNWIDKNKPIKPFHQKQSEIRLKEKALSLKKEGYSLRQIANILNYKAHGSVQKLLK